MACRSVSQLFLVGHLRLPCGSGSFLEVLGGSGTAEMGRIADGPFPPHCGHHTACYRPLKSAVAKLRSSRAEAH